MGIIIFNLWDYSELKDNTHKAWISVHAWPVFAPISLSKASSENKGKAPVSGWADILAVFPVHLIHSATLMQVCERTFPPFISYVVHKRKPGLIWLYFSFYPGSFHQIPRIKKKQKRVSKCKHLLFYESICHISLMVPIPGLNHLCKSRHHHRFHGNGIFSYLESQ